jgi:tubulin polyglutamylase TTLL1
MVKNIKRFRA